ncbi:MAG: hypothetical protein HFG34_09230 [Eubacterium sp.]|nr:hypothetical protein [Eubacterium sp.]
MHSKKLEDTMLWNAYQAKNNSDDRRSLWVKEIYEAAAKYLLDVRKTFPNYTLHDETHILNVLDAIGGLLGDQISQLAVGEMELLILAASLHDLGMVYTEEEKERYYHDEEACRKYLRTYRSELLGCPVEDWKEEDRQWYLRTLHPFRLWDALENEHWSELFKNAPLEIVSKECILAVCQAHGEKPEELRSNRELQYLTADDVDPLFCALLLRLGDLLDFDDTRAPRVLYSYVACNEKSREEWDKHQASAGFRYPPTPSADDLPYKARCTNPGVEHAVRDFLDWIDEELGNCFNLQKYCRAGWRQEFTFPRAVMKSEIESHGYMSGDFCLTMDQTQILELLTGENLYDHSDVFVRELLQNAIDATLLRGEMEADFIPENSRIDIWEWTDQEGYMWFRIDDQGTGMTAGMLQRYFLKVGNSYYNSQELERDLRDHGHTNKYNGISRFGIGFLSSFLCGEYAEVSTLYFDPKKNYKEEARVESYQTLHFGLRLQVTGLSGYYTLKNQSRHHQADKTFPAPGDCGSDHGSVYDRHGYRNNPGTSIAIRLNVGKLGTLNLREATEKYLCAARVPVYYNSKRIGRTYEEMMQAVHKVAGESLYEMSPELKDEFDRCFPAVCGQYPKLSVTVIPLDTEEDQVLPEFSGVIMNYDVHFDKEPQWKVKDQEYEIYRYVKYMGKGGSEIKLESMNIIKRTIDWEWKNLNKEFDLEKIAALESQFEKQSVCPKTEDLPGEVWKPFEDAMYLHEVWRAYCDHQQMAQMRFSVDDCGCPNIMSLSLNKPNRKLAYTYQGVIAGDFKDTELYMNSNKIAMFLLGSMWKPRVEVSRSRISGLPLSVLLAICGLFKKYDMIIPLRNFDDWNNSTIKEWRQTQISQMGQWMRKNLGYFFIEIKTELQKPLDINKNKFNISTKYLYNGNAILFKYLTAYLQDNYLMTINYEEGQKISFFKKDENEMEQDYDLFPPMMFCSAASDQSRRYLCCSEDDSRRGITADHPFAAWLLNNAVSLNQYFPRQFQIIVECLCNDYEEEVIEKCNSIRRQLTALPEHHGVDVSAFPELSSRDFWSVKEWDHENI